MLPGGFEDGGQSCAAVSLIPAIYPVETAAPASWHNSTVDRPTGVQCPQVRCAACTQVSDPKLARAAPAARRRRAEEASPGSSPRYGVLPPQPSQPEP